jgi:cation/acetate symporter
MAVNEAIKLRNNRLAQYYGMFTVGLIVFALIMGALELGAGMPKAWIGWTFLMLTMGDVRLHRHHEPHQDPR